MEPREMALTSQSTQKKVFDWQQLWGGTEDQDSARLAGNKVGWDTLSCLSWYLVTPEMLPFITITETVQACCLSGHQVLPDAKYAIHLLDTEFIRAISLWRGSSEGFKVIHKQFTKS